MQRSKWPRDFTLSACAPAEQSGCTWWSPGRRPPVIRGVGQTKAGAEMRGYYSAKLSGDRLLKCYEVAPARVQQYLEAEITFVLSRLRPSDSVLELGCGYGRVAFRLSEVAERVVGIDTAPESLALARQLAGADSRCEFQLMDASALRFGDQVFDIVVCIQSCFS